MFAVKEGRLCMLLVKRDFEPEKGKWSLIGGFTRATESVDAAAKRVLRELTGLKNVYMQQVGAFGDIDRDPGERVVSVAYFALLNYDDVDHAAVEESGAKWVEVDEIPPLGFDHPRMIVKAREEMRRRSLLAGVCAGTIAGFGRESYRLAVDYLVNLNVAR